MMLPPEEFPDSDSPTAPGAATPRTTSAPSDVPAGDDAQAELLDELATEFLDRYRDGERPSVAEYAEAWPDLAGDIRELFPTIARMEGFKVEIERPSQTGAATAAPRGKLRTDQLGDFRIIRELGRGGMGIVYEAEQTSLGRHVALKVLPLLSTLNPDLIRRFQREAKTAGRLHHSNIVPVFGVGESHGFHYYVMQMIDGIGLDVLIDETIPTGNASDTQETVGELDPLSDRGSSQEGTIAESQLRPQRSKPGMPDGPTARLSRTGTTRTRPTSGAEGRGEPEFGELPVNSSRRAHAPPSLQESIRIGVQAAEALQYAHDNGILHRDIKPGNLLLDDDGTLWVADFGLAKAIETDDITASGNIVGTVRYMAPEALQGKPDGRSDVYSLGVTLYEVLVGRRAWQQTDRSRLIEQIFNRGLTPLCKVNPSLPRDLETVIMKATARDLPHRYQTAAEFARDLQNILDDRPISARRITQFERARRWSRRNPVVSSLTGLSLTLLVFVAVVTPISFNAERQQRERAERTADTALTAIDEMFDQFAVDHPTTSPAGAGDTVGEQTPPMVSPETAKLLENFLTVYDQLADASDDDPELILKCAQARRRVGDIQQRLGQYDKSIESYRQAASQYEALETQLSGRAMEILLTRVGIVNEIGQVQQLGGRTEEARAAHRQAVSELESLPDESRLKPEALFELARSCYLLARRIQPGHSPLTELEDTFSHVRPNGFSDPRNRNRPPGGPGLPDRDGPPGREPISREVAELFGRAAHILEQLIVDHPDMPQYRYLLAVTLRDSNPERKPGDPAPGAMRTPETLLHELAQSFPGVPEYQHELAASWSRVDTFDIDSQSLEPVLVEENLTRARDVALRLVDRYPTVPAYTSTLIHIYGKLSHVQTQIARGFAGPDERNAVFIESERNLRAAIALQESLVRRFGDVIGWRLWLARFERRLAQMLLRNEREKEAREVLEDAIARLEKYDEGRELPSAGLSVLVSLFFDLEDTCTALDDGSGAIEARVAAQSYRDRLHESRSMRPQN